MLTQVCSPADFMHDETIKSPLFRYLVLGAVQDMEICECKFPA